MATEDVVKRFMEELDSDPALLEAVRARLLTRELLALPARFERFVETTQKFMDATQEFMNATDRRLETLERHVDSMRGDHLEMRVQGRVYSLLGGRDRNLRRTQVLKALFPGGLIPDFQNRVDSAELDGVITSEQYGRLLDTDLIASARHRDNPDQTVHIAMEVANRLNAGDIERVVDAGVALALVFPHSEILTLVYGRSISERNEMMAARKGVDVILTGDSR